MNKLKQTFALFVAIFWAISAFAQKTVYIPNDYNNSWSEHYCNRNGQNGNIRSLDDLNDAGEKWCKERSFQTDNIICLWEAGFGTDPKNMIDPANTSSTFDLTLQMEECEKILEYHINTLQATYPDGKNLQQYKVLFMLYFTTDWMAYGSGVDYTIGAMWVNPAAIGVGSTEFPYYVLSHELFHAMSYQAFCDRPQQNLNAFQDSYNGAFWEVSAQHAAMDIYPDNIEYLENYFFKNSYHFLNTRKHYAPSFILDELDDFVGDKSALGQLWTNNVKGEHVFNTIANTHFGGDWDAFASFVGHAAMRTVAMDYSSGSHGLAMRAERLAARNNDYSHADKTYQYYDVIKGSRAIPYAVDFDKRHFAIRDCQAPQDLGFNAMQLFPEQRDADGGATIRMRFRGHTGGDQFKNSGWRWGFVAVTQTGESRFGEVYSDSDRVVSFHMEPSYAELWLVVAGVPTEMNSQHFYSWEAGWPKYYRYPYEFRLENAVPNGFNADWEGSKNGGSAHPNGGGWVASTASVDASAYVGPNAKVLDKAVVSGNARIEDFAVVKGSAQISGDAVVKENALVYGNAKVYGNAVVAGEARVLNDCEVSGNSFVTDNVFLINTNVSGNAVVFGNLFVVWYNNYTIGGTALVGGDIDTYDDSNSSFSFSQGTYLQVPQKVNNGREAYDGAGNLSAETISQLADNWNDVNFRLSVLSHSISDGVDNNPNYDVNLTGLYNGFFNTELELSLGSEAAVNAIEQGGATSVFSSRRSIFVGGVAPGENVSVFNVSGTKVASSVSSGNGLWFSVPAGVYVVTVNAEAHKLVVY